jgi:hypothetical protein
VISALCGKWISVYPGSTTAMLAPISAIACWAIEAGADTFGKIGILGFVHGRHLRLR